MKETLSERRVALVRTVGQRRVGGVGWLQWCSFWWTFVVLVWYAKGALIHARWVCCRRSNDARTAARAVNGDGEVEFIALRGVALAMAMVFSL